MLVKHKGLIKEEWPNNIHLPYAYQHPEFNTRGDHKLYTFVQHVQSRGGGT